MLTKKETFIADCGCEIEATMKLNPDDLDDLNISGRLMEECDEHEEKEGIEPPELTMEEAVEAAFKVAYNIRAVANVLSLIAHEIRQRVPKSERAALLGEFAADIERGYPDVPHMPEVAAA